MIFFKKKKSPEETPQASQPAPKKPVKPPRSLQEIGQTRVLTAEGWKRRALKQRKGSLKKASAP